MIPKTLLLDDLSAPPRNAKLFLIGAGIPSKILKRRLISEREDLTILGFVDSVREGFVDKLPIFKPERLACKDYDGVVLPSKEYSGVTEPLLRAYDSPRIFEYSKDLLDANYFSPYVWLEDALKTITIDKPVLLLGKGPGLGLVPANAAETHFVISINQAFTHLDKSHLVFLLDLDHFIHITFTPGFGRKWEKIFVPDGLVKRFDNVTLDHLSIGETDFVDLQPQSSEPWGLVPELPFEEVDRTLDFSWIKERIIRFHLENVFWDTVIHHFWHKLDPGLTAFHPSNMGQPNVLKSGCNSAHLALSFLYRKGVKQITTAGMGVEEGYAKEIGTNVHYDPQILLQVPRWRGTLKVFEHLGIQCRRLEDLSDAEIKQKFSPKTTTCV
jgi:hypothetical protein